MEDIPKARTDEILKWLKQKVTPSEAIAEIRSDEEHITRVTIPETLLFRIIWFAIGGLLIDLFWRIVNGPSRPHSEVFADWVSSCDLSNAELWRYDTDGDPWEQLRGECGFAVVENGEITDFWMWFMN